MNDFPTTYTNTLLSENTAAKEAFKARVRGGLNLSDRVWNLTRQFQSDLELAIEASVSKGTSAQALSKSVRYYLNNPDKLFRRIRDKETGKLRLSKNALSYSPRRGVYRSSYKNAMRLARNEINFAYEHANFVKRKQLPYITGTLIKVSSSHNQADDKYGVKCYYLQGKYPVDFDFTYKWHVNCKCISYNILKTEEEINSDIDKILSGENPTNDSINKIETNPSNYTNYLRDTIAFMKNKPWTFSNNT